MIRITDNESVRTCRGASRREFLRIGSLALGGLSLSNLRSCAWGNADHQDYMTVGGGGNPTKAPMGSLYARIAGPNAVPSGMPNNVIIPAEAVKPGMRMPTNFETDSLRKFVSASQNLGANYAFFDPSGGGELRQNLELRLPAQRLTDRRGLLDRLDT